MENAQDNREVLFTVQEAAAEAGVVGSERLLYRMVKEREIKGGKFRGSVKIPRSEVMRLKALVEEERDAMTVDDVAEDLRVGRSTARRMMSEGEVPSRRRRFGRGAGGFICRRDEYAAWRQGVLSG